MKQQITFTLTDIGSTLLDCMALQTLTTAPKADTEAANRLPLLDDDSLPLLRSLFGAAVMRLCHRLGGWLSIDKATENEIVVNIFNGIDGQTPAITPASLPLFEAMLKQYCHYSLMADINTTQSDDATKQYRLMATDTLNAAAELLCAQYTADEYK